MVAPPRCSLRASAVTGRCVRGSVFATWSRIYVCRYLPWVPHTQPPVCGGVVFFFRGPFKGANSFVFDSIMVARDWVKLRNVFGGSTTGGPLLLDDPENYVVKSQIQIGYNPSDVKRGEEEFTFKGERVPQLESAFDTFATLVRKACEYLGRCKKVGHTDTVYQNLSTEARTRIMEGAHEDGDPGDVSACRTMGGRDTDLMILDAKLMCIVWFEILPRGGEGSSDEAQNRKRRRDHSTQTSVNRVRIYAALVVEKASASKTDFTFNTALNMVQRENRERLEAENNPRDDHGKRKRGSMQPLKPPRAKAENVVAMASDRPMHSDRVVTLDHWLDVGRAVINQQDCPWVAAWSSADANNIMQTDIYNDRVDPFLCAGDPLLKGTSLEYTRAEHIYGWQLECGRRASDKCAQSAPKYVEQLQDTSYLMHHICADGAQWPDDMRTVRARLRGSMQALDIDEMQPELLGLSFRHLPAEVKKKCIIQIDPCNIDGNRWLMQRPPLCSWWEEIQEFENSTQLGHSDAIVRPHSGLSAPFMSNGVDKMDSALNSGQLMYRPRSKKNTGNEVLFSNMLTPFHYASDTMTEMIGHHSGLVHVVRSASTSTSKLKEICPKLLPQHMLLCRQMHSMLMLRHDQTVPVSTKNVCHYITDEANGFLGKKENLIRRVVWRSLAPDMESGCNAMAMTHIMLEQLGCSSMHSTCYLVFLAVLQTMASKKGLAIHPCLHGLGGAGKTWALVNTVKKFMIIDGTMVVEGYSSRLAMLGVDGYKIDLVTLIDEGLDYVLSSAENGPSNVGLGDSTLKLRLSECVISASTLTHIDGKKVTIKQESLAIGSMIFLTNAGSLQRCLGQALRDRMIDVDVPCVTRKHKGITDKIAEGTSNVGKDDRDRDMSTYFKGEQAFAWLIGKASTFFGFKEADMSAFAPVCKQYATVLAEFGVKLSPRDITRAAMIAQQRAMEAVYHSEFGCPHGRMTGYTDVTIERVFDAQHSIESALIVSEAMAISSMGMILSKHNRVGALDTSPAREVTVVCACCRA